QSNFQIFGVPCTFRNITIQKEAPILATPEMSSAWNDAWMTFAYTASILGWIGAFIILILWVISYNIMNSWMGRQSGRGVVITDDVVKSAKRYDETGTLDDSNSDSE
ncbi:hypothetical protein Ocin01_00134, partial [Orchesella cincta]